LYIVYHKMSPILFAKALILLIIIDMIWLSSMGNYYGKVVERIQHKKMTPRVHYGFIVYLFMAIMLLQTKTWQQAFLYGVCIYGVFDFTNLTIFENYTLIGGIADTIWGGVLFAIARYILNYIS
jgi:uncharacterized membrane protein